MPRSARRQSLPLLSALGLVAALLACGPTASPGAGSAPPRPASGQPASAAPAQPAAAQVASSAAPAGWEQTVAAAKQEGRLVISAPANTIWREQLTGFQKEYPEIQVEYTGGNSRDFWPRVAQERAGRQYL